MAQGVGLQLVVTNASATGAGGQFPNDIYRYEIEILQQDTVVHVLRGTAFVPTDEGRIPYIVLGRDSIFQDFDIIFRERERRVIFRPSIGAP